MERRAPVPGGTKGLMQYSGQQYEALLDRSERVTWQRDCYMDLQSSHSGPSSKADAHGSLLPLPHLAYWMCSHWMCSYWMCSRVVSGAGWVLHHQQQLQRFTTTSFLRRALAHLRAREVLTVVEEMRVEAGGGRPVEEQVLMLLSLLADRAPQGPDALQAFVENSDSHEARLILSHGTATAQSVQR